MHNKPIAIAVYCTNNADLYDVPLFNNEDVEAVRNGEHSEINDDVRVIIVFKDMTTEDLT